MSEYVFVNPFQAIQGHRSPKDGVEAIRAARELLNAPQLNELPHAFDKLMELIDSSSEHKALLQLFLTRMSLHDESNSQSAVQQLKTRDLAKQVYDKLAPELVTINPNDRVINPNVSASTLEYIRIYKQLVEPFSNPATPFDQDYYARQAFIWLFIKRFNDALQHQAVMDYVKEEKDYEDDQYCKEYEEKQQEEMELLLLEAYDIEKALLIESIERIHNLSIQELDYKIGEIRKAKTQVLKLIDKLESDLADIEFTMIEKERVIKQSNERIQHLEVEYKNIQSQIDEKKKALEETKKERMRLESIVQSKIAAAKLKGIIIDKPNVDTIETAQDTDDKSHAQVDDQEVANQAQQRINEIEHYVALHRISRRGSSDSLSELELERKLDKHGQFTDNQKAKLKQLLMAEERYGHNRDEIEKQINLALNRLIQVEPERLSINDIIDLHQAVKNETGVVKSRLQAVLDKALSLKGIEQHLAMANIPTHDNTGRALSTLERIYVLKQFVAIDRQLQHQIKFEYLKKGNKFINEQGETVEYEDRVYAAQLKDSRKSAQKQIEQIEDQIDDELNQLQEKYNIRLDARQYLSQKQREAEITLHRDRISAGENRQLNKKFKKRLDESRARLEKICSDHNPKGYTPEDLIHKVIPSDNQEFEAYRKEIEDQRQALEQQKRDEVTKPRDELNALQEEIFSDIVEEKYHDLEAEKAKAEAEIKACQRYLKSCYSKERVQEAEVRKLEQKLKKNQEGKAQEEQLLLEAKASLKALKDQKAKKQALLSNAIEAKNKLDEMEKTLEAQKEIETRMKQHKIQAVEIRSSGDRKRIEQIEYILNEEAERKRQQETEYMEISESLDKLQEQSNAIETQSVEVLNLSPQDQPSSTRQNRLRRMPAGIFTHRQSGLSTHHDAQHLTPEKSEIEKVIEQFSVEDQNLPAELAHVNPKADRKAIDYWLKIAKKAKEAKEKADKKGKEEKILEKQVEVDTAEELLSLHQDLKETNEEIIKDLVIIKQQEQKIHQLKTYLENHQGSPEEDAEAAQRSYSKLRKKKQSVLTQNYGRLTQPKDSEQKALDYHANIYKAEDEIEARKVQLEVLIRQSKRIDQQIKEASSQLKGKAFDFEAKQRAKQQKGR